jgi:hypothetical protein
MLLFEYGPLPAEQLPSGSLTCGTGLDLDLLPGAEAEIDRAAEAEHLAGSPRSDDRAGHRWIAQHPAWASACGGAIGDQPITSMFS